MEKKTKFTRKMLSLFWAFIGGLPIIIFLVLFINGTFRQDFTLNMSTAESLITSINANGFISWNSELFSNWLYGLESVAFGLEESNNIVYFVNAVINWYIITNLIHLLVDLLLFLPNVVKNLLKKVGVKDVE